MTTRPSSLLHCLCAVLALGSAASAAAQQTSAAWLRTLSGSCANCHGTLGHGSGAMPSLAGLPKTHLAEQMRLFRDGKRPATVMHQLAKGYTDEQIEALAEHFARQPPAPNGR